MRKGRSRHRKGLAFFSVMVGALVALAACGQTTSHTVSTRTNTPTTGIERATATPTSPPAPTPVSPPYSFQKTWQVASGGTPHVISSFAFAAVAPYTGYACAITGSSSAPGVYRTANGGQSWTPANTLLFSKITGCQLSIDQADAADVFLLTSTPDSQGQWVRQLYRSRDSGDTWKQLSTVHDPVYSQLVMENVVVAGTRLIALAGISGEGRLPDPLYASDDGGASWHTIGQSILQQNLVMDELLWTAGTRIIVAAGPPCQGCGPLDTPLTGDRGDTRLNAHVATSSGSPPPTYYFSSVDGGTTWNKMSLPSDHMTWMNYARSADGSHIYGAALEEDLSARPPMQVPLFSGDNGATWRTLPTLANVEGGYIDATQVNFATVATDGSVLVPTLHTLPGNGGNSDAGIFRLRPGAGESWQPLVSGWSIQFLQTVPTAGGGTRVWAMQNLTPQGGTLVYIDLPA